MTAAQVARALGGARRSGSGWVAKCPSHDDRTPSLSLTERDGKLLVYCHAGCPQANVVDALRSRGLWPTPERRRDEWLEWRPGIRYPAAWGRIVREYVYRDANGRELYSVFRLEPKTFRQGFRDNSDRWVWRKHPHQVPYRLPELLDAEIAFVVEGEKDADTLAEHGFAATCNAGGAGKWARLFHKHNWARYFADKTILVIPDNDAPGLKHAAEVVSTLRGVAREVGVIQPPASAKDVAEAFESGVLSDVSLCELVDRALRHREGGMNDEEIQRRAA